MNNYFNKELEKISRVKDKNSESYYSSMKQVVPYAALQGVIDFPRGTLDSSIKNKVVRGSFKSPKKNNLKYGIGKGLGRFVGSVATTPLLLKGINQISNAKTKKDRREGYKKALGAGLAFSAIKSGIMGVGEHGSPFKRDATGQLTSDAKKALQKIKRMASVRSLIGLGAMGLTAKSISSNIKPKRKEKSFYSDVVKPTAAGLGIGAGAGALESLYVNRGSPNLKRKVLGSALGRGASGAVGGLVLENIIKNLNKKDKK